MSNSLDKGFHCYIETLANEWPEGLIVVDVGGRVVALNVSGEKILSYNESSIVGKQLHSLLCSKAADYQHDVDECPIRNLIDNGDDGETIEAWWVDNAGSYVNVDVKKVISNLSDTNETLISFQETSGENVGQAASQRLALFAELNPSPILELNDDCGIEFANPEMTNLMVEYGFNDVGRPIVLPEDVEAIVSECIREGTTLTNREASFDDRAMIWNFHPVLESKPIVVQVYGIDVTELARTRSQLNKAKNEAVRANESKSMFLANMSHEMRTPMNSILGFSGLIQETEMSQVQVNYINKIKLSASSLLEVINDILDFSKIEAGKLEFEINQFDIREEVEVISDLFCDRIEDKSLGLIISVDPAIPSGLMGDSLRIKQVAINLVSNAVKFTAQGDIVFTVELTESSDDAVTLLFSIKDSGIGIEANKVEKLFSAFSQADESTTRKYGGTGLGLSICKTLVEMMDGDIGVKSVVGEGSTFYFSMTLPISLESKGNYLELEYVDFKDRQVCYLETNKNKQAAVMQLLESYQLKVSSFSEDPNDQLDQLSLLDAEVIIVGAGVENSRLFTTIMSGALVPDGKPIVLALPISGKENDFDLDRVSDPVWIESPIKQSQVILALQKTLLGLDVEIVTKQVATSEKLDTYNGVHILVVDDNSFNQELAVDILKNQGITSDVAENGRVALEKMEETSYDIVLMDIQMPVMGGHEATRMIRKNANLKHNIVIAMTANVIKGEMDKCYEVGMDDYVAKPINVEFLFSIINKYVPEDKRTKKVTTTVVVNTEEGLPDELPGIKIKQAIKLIGGRETLFVKLAGMFVDNFSTAPVDIRNLLDIEDHESAIRLAHTIKGSAGNLAAVEVSEAARVLETALKNKETDLDDLIATLDSHLKVVFESIEVLNKNSV